MHTLTDFTSSLKLTRLDRSAAKPSPSPIFVGHVETQSLVSEGDTDLLRVTAVTFADGARNLWHAHSTDQVLVVTEGRGIVATEDEEIVLGEGDVVMIPAGRRHWHGAVAGETFTHLSILTPGEMTIDESV